VLIKGADYTIEQVVGADIVQAHGGRVALIPLEQGHSTTGTIRRINASQ
jgi:D-beta-D-heptose 7-phosphate kinase/D-beta-D-heptose 1-phosphate adenosyltransferase